MFTCNINSIFITRKAVYFLYAGILSILISNFTQAESIRMAYFELQPHHFTDKSGQAKGAGVIYFNQLANKLGYEVEWVGPLPFGRILHQLKKGEIDGSLSFSYTKDRSEFLNYADMPYMIVKSVLAMRADHPLNQVHRADDITGLKVGYIDKAYQSKFIKVNHDKIEMFLTASGEFQQKNVRLLLSNRIDAIYSPSHDTINYLIKSLNLEKEIKMVFLPEEPDINYFAFSKKSEIADRFLKSTKNFDVSQIPNYQDVVLNYSD